MPSKLPAAACGTVLFDGDCLLCSGWVSFLRRHDRKRLFQLESLQSPVGQALLHACGLPQDYRNSVLLVRDGLALSQSQAVIAILTALPYPWNLASLLHHIPRRLRDRLYSWIAKNRQRIPLLRPHCTLPQSR